VGHPLEDVSLCESLRCMWGGCESRVYVLWDLVVLGFPFLSFSKRVFERGWGGCPGWVPRCRFGGCVRLPRVCLVSIVTCNFSVPSRVPSIAVGFGLSWCVLVW
jgi:hypothetical protein